MIALLLGGCASNGLEASCPVRWLPPLEFDHDPVPYPVVWQLDQWDADGACRSAENVERGGSRIYACAYVTTIAGESIPSVIVDKVGPGINQHCQDLEVEHEFGHSNGWPPNHPNARRAN